MKDSYVKQLSDKQNMNQIDLRELLMLRQELTERGRSCSIYLVNN